MFYQKGTSVLNPPPIVFFGSYGHAQSWRMVTRRVGTLEPLFDVVAYIDDFRGDTGIEVDGLPVISFPTYVRTMLHIPCFVSIASPAARRRIVQRLIDVEARLPAIYDLEENGTVTVGSGSAIAAGVRVGKDTIIGEHVQVMPGVTIPENTIIGDYTTFCPKATLSGRVKIGKDVFVGAGAKIDGSDAEISVGNNVVISAGAVLRSSVDDNLRVFGNPARAIDGMHIVPEARG